MCVYHSCALTHPLPPPPSAALAARTLVVDKLDKAVEKLSTEEDEQEFIESYKVGNDTTAYMHAYIHSFICIFFV